MNLDELRLEIPTIDLLEARNLLGGAGNYGIPNLIDEVTIYPETEVRPDTKDPDEEFTNDEKDDWGKDNLEGNSDSEQDKDADKLSPTAPGGGEQSGSGNGAFPLVPVGSLSNFRWHILTDHNYLTCALSL